MTDRPLYFELHIRPMFREIDYLHMKQRGIDLWNAEVVAKKVSQIITFLTLSDPDQVMPAQDTGGPWPAEWIAVIKRWRDNFSSQSLPRGAGTYSITKNTPRAGLCTLRATGSPSKSGAAVWLDRVPGRANPPEYVLYEEPPRAGFAGSFDPFELDDAFDPAGAKTVRVNDRNGAHDVAIP
jgi:hypothetical protein